MLRNTLKRQARADYLRRLENSARTVEDFEEVVDTYDKLDANRERRERYNEIRQGEYNLQYSGSKRGGYRLTYSEIGKKDGNADDAHEEKDKPSETAKAVKPGKSTKKESSKNYVYNGGAIIPAPICHPYWRELMRGEFIDYIFDNCREAWQIFGEWQMGCLYRCELTAKQKEALFLSAVRLATTAQIGCYTDKSGRAVRRLLADALERIRGPLAEMIQHRLDGGFPVTLEKRRFLERHALQDGQKETPGGKPGDE